MRKHNNDKKRCGGFSPLMIFFLFLFALLILFIYFLLNKLRWRFSGFWKFWQLLSVLSLINFWLKPQKPTKNLILFNLEVLFIFQPQKAFYFYFVTR